MSKIIVAAVICSLFVAIQAASLPKETSTTASTIIVEDIDEYLRQNPHLKVEAELERSVVDKVLIRYTLGRRVNGDRLVGTSNENNFYGKPQDVLFRLSYPVNGAGGAIISLVQVDVDQTTNVGRGYVVSGGIGQRRISIAIEAKGTYHFKQNSRIFGY